MQRLASIAAGRQVHGDWQEAFVGLRCSAATLMTSVEGATVIQIDCPEVCPAKTLSNISCMEVRTHALDPSQWIEPQLPMTAIYLWLSAFAVSARSSLFPLAYTLVPACSPTRR